MPAYLPKINGLRISAAYAEAMASAPITRVMLSTYEFNHPNFRDTLGAVESIRIVNDFTDLVATIEAGAPMDAGTEVTFTAVPCTVTGPGEGDTGEAQVISLTVDGVSGELAAQLDLALGSNVPVTVLERIYASDDLAGPAQLPVLEMILRNVNVSDVSVTAQPTFFDASNSTFPRTEYSKAEYPGLSAR
jgi:hypothetical protein